MHPSRRRATEPLRTNVAEVSSVLVGRQRDLEGIAARFDVDAARLVTIVAPGGMGKTRLAARFAATRATEYSRHGGGGAWWFDLTHAHNPAAVCSTLAATLGVSLDARLPESDLIETLARSIARRKHSLFVLDNFEQLVPVARDLLQTWLRLAPLARFIVTSRVVLGLPEEFLWSLGPLDVPSESTDGKLLRDIESVDLFVRRVRALREGFAPSASELRVIADIVRGADGIPLAIELAAARAAVLSIQQIRERLDAPLELLARPDDHSKHASMRRAISSSFAQLDPAAGQCLVACAIFRTSFSLEAAERVIGPLLPQLESLHACSLLRSTRLVDGSIRFSFYETIREFAVERLSALGSMQQSLAGRHAQYFGGVANAMREPAGSTPDATAHAQMAHDADEFEAALTVALERTQSDRDDTWGRLAMRLAGVLDLARAPRGMPRQRIERLDAVVAAAERVGAAETVEMAEVLLARGSAHRDVCDFDAAKRDHANAVTIAQRIESPLLEALAHTRAGELIELSGATSEARTHFIAALARLRVAVDSPATRLREADTRARLGHALRREGSLDDAEREIEIAVDLFRRAVDEEGLCQVLYEAAIVGLFRKRYDAAKQRIDEGLLLANRLGARQLEAALNSALGTMLLEMGDLDEALAHHARAVSMFRDLGNRFREGSALYYLAGAHLVRGERDAGERTLRSAIAIVRAAGFARYEALTESCLATVLADRSEREHSHAAMQRAEAAAAACRSEPTLMATIEIHKIHIDVALAPQHDALVRARAIAECWPCDDPRFALQLLETRERPSGESRQLLTLARDGQRFRLSEPKLSVDLSRRAPLRRILVALAHHHTEAPGEELSVDDIVAMGWPGERIARTAAVNRAYVALATLRRLGLRDVIVRSESGYQLTPKIRVEWDAADSS
jgi:predicted ATPase/tetratricopeptide (TPR) repeat protein